MDKLQQMVEMQKSLLGLNGILSDPYFITTLIQYLISCYNIYIV